MQNSSSTDNPNSFRGRDYVKITLLGLAISALWGSLHSIILPLRLLDMVAESQKNTYLGMLTLAGLLLAMAVQPLAGAISDRSNFKWGRRRPYILVGGLISALLILGIGWAGTYAAIFAVYCLLQISANTAQGPFQAFIPDLVPVEKRGVAASVKSLMELAGGIGLVYVVIILGNYILGDGNAWIWLVLVVLVLLMLAGTIITVIIVKETPAEATRRPPQLSSLIRSYRVNLNQSPGFIYFLLSRFFFVMALTALQSFALYFFQDMVQVEDTATATVVLLIVMGAGVGLSVYPAGRLSDRVGRQPVLIFAGIIGAAGLLTLMLEPTYGFVMVGGLLIGISGGAFMSANWALATDLLPKGEEARYLGLANMATAGGAAMARLVGPGIDFFNSYRMGMGYQFMLLTSLVYIIIASALVLKIRKS